MIKFRGEKLHPVTMMVWYDGALQDGEHLSIGCADPALLYGAMVFTTLRVYECRLEHPGTAWSAHCDRLHHSIQAFRWVEPDWSRLSYGATLMAEQYAVLRLTLFPDGREWITGRALPIDLAQRQIQGVIAWVDEAGDYGRSLPSHKTGNYLSCWLARQAAQRQGAEEAILVNPQNHWLETSTGTLWGWRQGQWYTPPLSAGILPGIARSRILSSQSAISQPVDEQPWSETLINQLTALFYSNSVVEAIPIRRILRNASALDYNPNQALLQHLRQRISEEMTES